MKRIMLLPLFTLTVNLLFSQPFTEQTGISLQGIYLGSVAWGDYDNDGYLDILLAGSNTDNGSTIISKIYRNKGNSTFIEQTGFSLPGVYYSSVDCGDYDNDGDLDILLTGSSGSLGGNPISKIYKNNGNKTFTEQTGISLPGVKFGSVAWGDYDNDGDLDILLTGENSNYKSISKIYKNNGDNTFTEQTGISLTGVDNSSVAWGDYDNDGDLDILLTGRSDSGPISKIYKNNGDKTFSEQTGISITGVHEGSVAWGDYDNDGDLDILLTGTTWSPSIPISKIYKNNGDNTFSEQTGISLTGVYYSSVAWGDYDNDGDLDILLTGWNGSSRISNIYKNNSDNTFTEQNSISITGVTNSSVAWGDYDNDGDLDILLTGWNGSSRISKIYKNESSIVNFCPAAPTCSIPIVNKNSVTLSWGQATDTQTPSDGLTYNLFIKKVSDGSIPMSPMSDISTGFRRIVQLGNMNQVLAYTVKNLDCGEYEWYIQAIDNCFLGSAFSKGQNFRTVPLAPTDLIANAISGTEINLSWVDNSKYETGYVVERSVGNNQNFSVIATLNSNSISYADKVLPPGTLYYYRIKALDNDISSEYSNEADVIITSFVEQTSISLIGIYNGSVAWGDYDNDGDLDILLTGKSDSGAISKIYKNNGDNSFTEQTEISLTGVFESSVAWGDYDNDGDLDILLTGYTGSLQISSIYKNNGNNTFTEQTGISLTGVSSSSVAWGDFDNDGDLDILLTGYSNSGRISKIYKNNSDNTFTEQTGISLTGVSFGSVASVDYDNDGDLDILLTGSSDWGGGYPIFKIYKNNGNNTFTEQTGLTINGVDGSSVAWGDYDNDGDLDILLTGDMGYSLSTYFSGIYKNDGNNSFTKETGVSLSGVINGSVAWGDYNNDGNLDFLLTGYNGWDKISKIYKNNGNNTFFIEQAGNSLLGVEQGSVAWGDYDNDGDLDILYTGKSSSGNISKIYKNTSSPINTPPTIPGKLTQTVNENSVTFTWDKATDNETPQSSLSYNLFIQTIDGKIIKSPLSDNISGTRKIVTDGNVGQTNSWTIKDLPAGIYAWSVQAIDQSFAGSPFAPLRIFSVGNPIVLDKPKTPEGATIHCSSSLNSEYATNSVPGATSYSWSINPSDAGVITGDSKTAFVEWSDTYLGIAKISVIAINNTANFGISASSDSLSVAINTKPEKPIITKTGTVLQSSATSGNQWYKQNELIPGANQQELTSTGDGNYYVIVTEEGCSSDPSDPFIVTDIEKIKSKGMVEVYPNPVAQNLTIVPVDNNLITYEFIDLSGKLIQKGSISGKTVVETSHFMPGIYLLKIGNGETNEFIKIIKEE